MYGDGGVASRAEPCEVVAASVVVLDGEAVLDFVVNVADVGDDDDRFPARVCDVNAYDDVVVDAVGDVVADVASSS